MVEEEGEHWTPAGHSWLENTLVVPLMHPHTSHRSPACRKHNAVKKHITATCNLCTLNWKLNQVSNMYGDVKLEAE